MVSHASSSNNASVLAETVKSVRIGVSLAGLPLFLEVHDPMVVKDRRPLVRHLVEAHYALIAPLPRPCDDSAANIAVAGTSAAALAALAECWEPTVLQQIESHLVKLELLSGGRGEYWPLAAFYRGVDYSNEANRLVLSVVTLHPDTLLDPAAQLLRAAIAHNALRGKPLAAASSTLAQLLHDGGRPTDQVEAFNVLRASVLAVPGHDLRHAHLQNCQSHHRHTPVQGGVSWRDAVQAAPLSVVCVATRRTMNLRNLERSAAALGHEVTVLGLGQPWSGFGLKVTTNELDFLFCSLYISISAVTYYCCYIAVLACVFLPLQTLQISGEALGRVFGRIE